MKNLVLSMTMLALICISGCGEFENVPPNAVGRKLTPSGWEDKIYSPGQVNIGEVGTAGQANSLVLIQTSAFTVKEAFIGKEGNEDGEDHRLLTADQTPTTLDIRFMFTCPDIDQNTEAVKRLFTLGNPKRVPDQKRVMEIRLESIYLEQAQLHVRGRIRDIIGGYKNFDELFEHRNDVNAAVRGALAEVLSARKVPLVLVDSQISNLKPDEMVWNNQIRIQAAQAEIDSMRKMEQYLTGNPVAQLIYKVNSLKDIAAIASKAGNTLFIVGALNNSSEGVGAEGIIPMVQKRLPPPPVEGRTEEPNKGREDE